MPQTRPSQPPNLLDEVWQILRLHHDSIHPERSVGAWSVR
jgi:hypothetical protein